MSSQAKKNGDTLTGWEIYIGHDTSIQIPSTHRKHESVQTEKKKWQHTHKHRQDIWGMTHVYKSTCLHLNPKDTRTPDYPKKHPAEAQKKGALEREKHRDRETHAETSSTVPELPLAGSVTLGSHIISLCLCFSSA